LEYVDLATRLDDLKVPPGNRLQRAVSAKGNTPEFWLNAQRAVDLWDAAQTIETEIRRIKPWRVA